MRRSAVGSAGLVLNIAAGWDDAADDAANIEWTRATWKGLHRFSTGGDVHHSFQTEHDGDERIRAAYGKNYERLVEVKTTCDSDDVFRVNKNIPPRGQVS